MRKFDLEEGGRLSRYISKHLFLMGMKFPNLISFPVVALSYFAIMSDIYNIHPYD